MLQRFSHFGSVAALAIASTFASVVAAAPPEGKEPPVDRTFRVPTPAPYQHPTANVLIPAPNQGEVPITEPFRQKQADRNAQALVPGPSGPLVGNETAEQLIQQRLQMLQAQQEQLARAYQETLAALEKTTPMKGQVAELVARQQLPRTAPLPENAVVKIFALRHVKPDEVAGVLVRITGSDNMRIAFDERTNSLLLAGAEKQLNIAEALIERLDQPGQEAEKRPAETLQLRVVWLLDGGKGMGMENGLVYEGSQVKEGFVSPPVIEALSQLGFGEPRVMCQQLTTLTIRPEERRSGQFHFQVPVLVGDDLWQFSGQGSVANSGRDKYALDIGLTVEQRDESNKRNSAELSGSIITPLAHYTVVGTTTFVATKLVPAEGDGRGKVVAGRNQHLAAFVVFLDRAREFGGESGKPEKEPAPRRREAL